MTRMSSRSMGYPKGGDDSTRSWPKLRHNRQFQATFWRSGSLTCPGPMPMINEFRFLDWLTSKPDYFVNKRGIMQFRRALALFIAAAMLAPAPSALAQRNNQPQQQQPKRSKVEQADIDALSNAVDFAATGKAANDVALKWEMSHFLKSPDGTTVFPFVVAVDKATLPANEAALYIRVMEKSQIAALAAMAAAAADKDKDKKDAKTAAAAPPSYPWQNIYFIDMPADG